MAYNNVLRIIYNMKLDAVFSGGGVKGIGFIGAICCMEDKGAKWQRLAGTSAGAIAASLIAVGYTGKEMKEILFNLNFLDFTSPRSLHYIPFIGKPAELFINKGFYSSEPVEALLNDLYKKKGKRTFKDISINGVSQLKVIASDVTNRKVLILPEDIKFYGIDPMELDIAKAVRMSMNVPFLFSPVILKYAGKEACIVDGGIMSNFPVWLFDVTGIPKWPTFGFKFKTPDKAPLSSKKNTLLHYTKNVAGAILDTYDDVYLNDKDSVRTIDIKTPNINSLDFKVSSKEKSELFKCGYDAADDFLSQWNFQEYVRKYRKGI